jgi:serine/threonine protein kinase
VTVSDDAIDRLRRLDDRPDFSRTRYQLGDDIGRGGMGVVYRAHDRELERDVAIKVLAWPTDADSERLRREARTLAALEHAGIVPVHDAGRLPDGRVFFVMSLVRGERLDVHAATLARGDRLRLFDRICDTVAFAHAHGVIHRDLKPANILVGEFGQVQIVDWGLAGGSEPGGTEGYMAPEQRTRSFDARVDVYALGAILAALTSGSGSRPLGSIVKRAMDPDPSARYPTPAALAADVRRFVDGQAVLAHRETALEHAGRLLRTYRTPITLVLAYLAMRVLLLLWPAAP